MGLGGALQGPTRREACDLPGGEGATGYHTEERVCHERYDRLVEPGRANEALDEAAGRLRVVAVAQDPTERLRVLGERVRVDDEAAVCFEQMTEVRLTGRPRALGARKS